MPWPVPRAEAAVPTASPAAQRLSTLGLPASSGGGDMVGDLITFFRYATVELICRDIDRDILYMYK